MDTTNAAPETVTIEGTTYTVVERMMPGSARRSHGAPVLDLVAVDGSVAGSITLRRSPKSGYLLAVRKGAAKGLSEYTARKMVEAR